MEPLKNMYSNKFLSEIADIGAATLPGFDRKRFLNHVLGTGWELLELKQRIRRISTALAGEFTGEYPEDLNMVLLYTKALHKHSGRDDSFLYMFIPDYIEQYGLAYPAISLEAMAHITILSSCEYAIRQFIIADQNTSLQVMFGWTSHPHPSVRRLASEGCRPRLPWAIALPALKRDPTPVLPILERLCNDDSEFVRRSVANNLNDIAKDNPAFVLQLAEAWMGRSQHTDRIFKHGCRTLLKKADARALGIFGWDDQPQCAVVDLVLENSVISIGDHLVFSFGLVNQHEAARQLRVEYAITYAKANSKTGRKVFKITENEYQPGNMVTFRRRQSFADMTTRRHYAGAHVIEILINGMEKARALFEVKE
jgi:3-methyladenine DNA glycosylase AlkC